MHRPDGNERPTRSADVVAGEAPIGSAPGDTTPPSAPTALSATAASSTQVNLSWTAASDNVAVALYRIYRNGVQANTSSGVTFTDTGLTPNTAYAYTVTAVDAAGNESPPSNSREVSTPPSSGADTQPPTTPTNLRRGAATTTSIELLWDAATDNVGVARYRILRNGSAVGTTTGTSFTDTGLAAGTSYSYTVIALDAADNQSPPSAALSAATSATPTPPPAAPSSGGGGGAFGVLLLLALCGMRRLRSLAALVHR